MRKLRVSSSLRELNEPAMALPPSFRSADTPAPLGAANTADVARKVELAGMLRLTWVVGGISTVRCPLLQRVMGLEQVVLC